MNIHAVMATQQKAADERTGYGSKMNKKSKCLFNKQLTNALNFDIIQNEFKVSFHGVAVMCAIFIFVVVMKPNILFPLALVLREEYDTLLEPTAELEGALRECADKAGLPYVPPILTDESLRLAEQAPMRFIKQYLREVRQAEREGSCFVHF